MVSEPIQRSETEKNDYFRWLNEQAFVQFLETVKAGYWSKRNNEQGKVQVHLLQMPYSNGFALTYEDGMGKGFQHFFDLLKDRTINAGYWLQIADRKLFDRGKYVETKEKYYLKPPYPKEIVEGQLMDQLFGNVLIEQILIDNRPSYLKYTASVYSDRLYKDAGSFDDLVEQLFSH